MGCHSSYFVMVSTLVKPDYTMNILLKESVLNDNNRVHLNYTIAYFIPVLPGPLEPP